MPQAELSMRNGSRVILGSCVSSVAFEAESHSMHLRKGSKRLLSIQSAQSQPPQGGRPSNDPPCIDRCDDFQHLIDTCPVIASTPSSDELSDH